MLSKMLQLVKLYQNTIFIALCLVLISFISYNLGRINSFNKEPISVSRLNANNNPATIFNAVISPSPSEKRLDTRVVASKNSDKYHYAWCSGAKRIKEENKIWFNSAEEAQKAGYTLAGNCLP